MKLFNTVKFAIWLMTEILRTATAVVIDTMRPNQKQSPVLIGLPVRIDSDFALTAYSASISMTPGTLVVGTRELAADDAKRLGGHKYLYIVHAIFGADLEELFDSLYDMEERLAPDVKQLPRPAGILFDEYTPHQDTDAGARVGTAREAEEGLPLDNIVYGEAKSNSRVEEGS